jgi:hypothetical protein
MRANAHQLQPLAGRHVSPFEMYGRVIVEKERRAVVVASRR